MINKAYVIVIIIVLCVIAYFNWRAREKATDKKKTGGADKKTAPAAAPSDGNKASGKATASPTASPGAAGLSPNTLYKMVHQQMVNGMSHADFADVAPKYDVGMVYVEIKQLYAGDKIPTASDYARVLKNENV